MATNAEQPDEPKKSRIKDVTGTDEACDFIVTGCQPPSRCANVEEPPELTDEDDEILNRIWDRLG